jgi:hypothetical protein
MKSQDKMLGGLLLLLAVTLIVSGCGCLSDDTQVQSNNTSDITNQSVAVNAVSNETNATEIAENPSSTTEGINGTEDINASHSLDNMSISSLGNKTQSNITIVIDSNSKYNNNLTAAGSVTKSTTGPVVSEYEIKLNLTNTGAPFSFNCAQVAFDNGKGGAYFYTKRHTVYTSADGERLNFVKIARGETFTESFESYGNEKELLQNSDTGKLSVHISLYMGDPTLENSTASFHTVIPRSEELVNDREYQLTFTDFETAQKEANPSFVLRAK